MESPSEAPAFLKLSKAAISDKFNDLEWRQRLRMVKSMSPEGSRWARLSGDDVLERNRYINIDPWANNRVLLQVPEGQCDYINASPIEMKSSRDGEIRRFIATQGPKESSTQQFWQMIWQETKSIGVIVMLTQTYEAGREKCFEYFPQAMAHDASDEKPTSVTAETMADVAVTEQNGESTNGATEMNIRAPDEADTGFEAHVHLLDTHKDKKTRSTIRKLCLRVGEKEKIVYHYLFEGWPDFSVPEGKDRLALIELIKQTAAVAGEPDNPRVIHCSAGVGRTGTFIALDHLLHELEDGALDNVPADQDRIADTVDMLREQRMMMVQGESQFYFLYKILKAQWLGRHGLAAAAAGKRKEIAEGTESDDTPMGSPLDSPTDGESKF